jgi:hypothetical protein
LIAGESLESLNIKEDFGRIACIDFKGDEIWHYSFRDTVFTESELLSVHYKTWILDTLTFNKQKILFAIAQNHQSFSSAIFCLDLKTGNRIAGTLWNAGFIIKGIVVDLDSDGNKEIVAICHNNGFESPAIFVVDVRKLNGLNPAPQNYKLVGKSNAKLNRYILLPKTDFTNYYNETRLGALSNYLGFRDDLNKIFFGTKEGNSSGESGEVWYYLDKNLKDFDIVIGEDLRIKRDSLVGRGILSYPLTDTYKYREILKSKILYWKNGKWVKREELD